MKTRATIAEKTSLDRWRELIKSPEADKVRKDLGRVLSDFRLCVMRLEEIAAKDGGSYLKPQPENVYVAVLEEACRHMLQYGDTQGLGDYVNRYHLLYRTPGIRLAKKRVEGLVIAGEDFHGEFRITATKARTSRSEPFGCLPDWRED